MPYRFSISPTRAFAALLLLLASVAALRADALRFPDGEVVRGTFIRRENGEIVFQSKNLGVVRISEDKVILEIESVLPLTTAPVADQSTPNGTTPAETAPVPSTRGVLKKISKRVEREIVSWWEPWKGRLAASLNIVNDVNERSEYLVEGRANRQWTKDIVSVETRYEYRKVNAQLNTDQIRTIGNWRHDLSERYFTSYRPEAIRDRINSGGVQPFPYFMLRQSVGAGIHLQRRQDREFRLGVAHEFFNVWALRDHQASSQQANSAFFEGEIKLPWRVSAKDRLVWHLTGEDGGNGWEHEFELTKKITDAVSFGVRQELRQNHPDPRVIDSERLRLLLTYDF